MVGQHLGMQPFKDEVLRELPAELNPALPLAPISCSLLQSLNVSEDRGNQTVHHQNHLEGLSNTDGQAHPAQPVGQGGSRAFAFFFQVPGEADGLVPQRMGTT